MALQRWLRCNGLLESVDKELIIDQSPLQVRQESNEFRRCQQCGEVFFGKAPTMRECANGSSGCWFKRCSLLPAEA